MCHCQHNKQNCKSAASLSSSYCILWTFILQQNFLFLFLYFFLRRSFHPLREIHCTNTQIFPFTLYLCKHLIFFPLQSASHHRVLVRIIYLQWSLTLSPQIKSYVIHSLCSKIFISLYLNKSPTNIAN